MPIEGHRVMPPNTTTIAQRSAMLQGFKQSADTQTYNKARDKAKALKMPLGHFIALCISEWLTAHE